MTKSVYIVAPEALAGKTTIALGAIAALLADGRKVGVFRPVLETHGRDSALDTLLKAANCGQRYAEGCGVTYSEVRQNRDQAITAIIDRFEHLRQKYDTTVIVGSDYSDVISPIEFALNVRIAANLNSPVLLVLGGRGQTASDLRHAASFCMEEMGKHYARALGIMAINVDADSPALADGVFGDVDLPILTALTGTQPPDTALPEDFVSLLDRADPQVRTPLRFQYELMSRAQSAKRTIILPEADDERVLAAAGAILDKDIANIILLGDAATIAAQADELGLDLSHAHIQDPTDPELLEKFAAEYARLRAHKGVTEEMAAKTLTDLSYFGTMMIHFGMADGMVSGARHTTANTIRPSLEFIKTKPGVSMVSGYFLMCLPDRVLVFADCAVTTNPTADQLADIGLASALTAEAFGIEPRVAMLSYSTGDSGTGVDVDLVREATALLRQRDPNLPAEGPIQFDAAIDPSVAETKLPNSPVAGHATVFVFPDLNTGNITYKAVQRTAKTLALGPILQGLRKPVNDLSRGALVDDIINTIAITAIQAQADPGAPFEGPGN